MKLSLDVPRPKSWDLIAMLVTAVGMVLMGANIATVSSSGTGATSLFVTIQLTVCMISLMLLGKTAKLGTIWGNLATVAGALVGMSGVLLAAALWVTG